MSPWTPALDIVVAPGDDLLGYPWQVALLREPSGGGDPGLNVTLTAAAFPELEILARRVRLALAVVEGVDDDDLEYALSQGFTYRELGRILGEVVREEMA